VDTDNVADDGEDIGTDNAVLISKDRASGVDRFSTMTNDKPVSTVPSPKTLSFREGVRNTCVFFWWRKLFRQSKHRCNED